MAKKTMLTVLALGLFIGPVALKTLVRQQRPHAAGEIESRLLPVAVGFGDRHGPGDQGDDGKNKQ